MRCTDLQAPVLLLEIPDAVSSATLNSCNLLCQFMSSPVHLLFQATLAPKSFGSKHLTSQSRPQSKDRVQEKAIFPNT